VLLERTGGTVLVEGALGDPWEHIDHGIHPLLLRNVREFHDIGAVREELAVEEAIHQIHLHDDVYAAENFAGPVPNGVQLVALMGIWDIGYRFVISLGSGNPPSRA